MGQQKYTLNTLDPFLYIYYFKFSRAKMGVMLVTHMVTNKGKLPTVQKVQLEKEKKNKNDKSYYISKDYETFYKMKKTVWHFNYLIVCMQKSVQIHAIDLFTLMHLLHNEL